ncbi:MAG: hypothetical protein L0H96_17875 [Humibacillus sp.]|uniref:hypothetical protein n=1 Tax=Intrasporangium sp. TaxID=1925024 RepID=UPI00264A4BB9|nr:hypothetical protein [Intrasporangium sp.]MDN5768117.1 hypothetical protein [Humibacillus sp.]MDN5778767.1 hypothetical protein [Humibacillus sp.]MDN5795393.1 hypothetical protein [Intrasporangium sp.]
MAGAAVIARGGSLACSHQGNASVVSVSSRLTVGGKGVLLSGKESGLDFAVCTNQTTSSPSSPAPCVSDAATAGLATKLTVGGTAVLLAFANGSTHPKVTPAAIGTWSVGGAGQSKLTAV